jgi:bifunctional non-homologous end joining protein LigD
VRWVEPEVVVEVEFASWTGDGRLRHPVFHGVRTDKRVDEARGDG